MFTISLILALYCTYQLRYLVRNDNHRPITFLLPPSFSHMFSQKTKSEFSRIIQQKNPKNNNKLTKKETILALFCINLRRNDNHRPIICLLPPSFYHIHEFDKGVGGCGDFVSLRPTHELKQLASFGRSLYTSH